MRQNSVIASIVSTLVLLGSVQYVVGGAVMSVDLGSEWMKVSNSTTCFFQQNKSFLCSKHEKIKT